MPITLTMLQTLCDVWSGYGTLQCLNAVSCPGSYNGNCIPHAIWSSSSGGTYGYPFHLYVDTGNVGVPSTNAATAAFTVRCVLDLKPESTQENALFFKKNFI